MTHPTPKQHQHHDDNAGPLPHTRITLAIKRSIASQNHHLTPEYRQKAGDEAECESEETNAGHTSIATSKVEPFIDADECEKEYDGYYDSSSER